MYCLGTVALLCVDGVVVVVEVIVLVDVIIVKVVVAVVVVIATMVVGGTSNTAGEEGEMTGGVKLCTYILPLRHKLLKVNKYYFEVNVLLLLCRYIVLRF